MKLDQLKYFIETSKHEHIGKAAKILNISPSAISHSIANLEEEFGRELFIKQGKRIFLTSHGKLLAERGVFLLREAERLMEEVRSDQVELQGHYRLAATHALCEEHMVPAWLDVKKAHPHVSGEIYTLRSAEVLSKICNGELDLGVCLSPQSNPLFDREILREGQLFVVVRKKHPILKFKGLERSKMIAQFPTVRPKAFQGIENCETHPAIKQHRMEGRVDLMFDSYSVAIRAVHDSDMWTLIPDVLFEKHEKLLENISPKGWDAPYNVSVIWPRDRIMTKLIQLVIATLKLRFHTV